MMIKSYKITLPDNTELKNFLKKKLIEYTQRVKKIKQLHPDKKSQLDYDSISRYKILLIKHIFAYGEVDTKRIADEIKEEFGFLNESSFNEAAQVVRDYCENWGKNVKMVSRTDSERK